MSDEAQAQPQAAPSPPETFSDPRAAVNWLTSRDEKPEKTEQPNSSVERAEPATAEHEPADEAGTASREEAPGGTEDNEPEDSLPPVERPRSWSKDDDDDWHALPRARQEKIAANERAREADINRRISETAEKLKGLTAKEQAAEQARQTFETQAKNAYDVLMREQVRDFPDIRSMEDVRNLAKTDPFRFDEWQVHQQELQAHAATVKEAEQRSNQEKLSKRTAYQQEQTAKLRENVPEFADAKKLDAAREKAIPLLNEYGLDLPTLNKWADSEAGFEILQHAGFQHLIADLLKSKDAEAARAKAVQGVVTKPIPPVVRPGARQNAGASTLQSATQAFNLNPDLRSGAAALAARRAASSRK